MKRHMKIHERKPTQIANAQQGQDMKAQGMNFKMRGIHVEDVATVHP